MNWLTVDGETDEENDGALAARFRAGVVCPVKLVAMIEENLLVWQLACSRTTTQQIVQAIPNVIPRVFQNVRTTRFPGIKKFDFVEWRKLNCPMLTTRNWLTLAKVIALNFPVDLRDIITLCDRLLY